MKSMPECIHHIPFDMECPQCIEDTRGRLPPILAATIATLPDKPPFSARDRETFFNMLRCAFDVAYGPVLDLFGGPTVIWRTPDDPPADEVIDLRTGNGCSNA